METKPQSGIPKKKPILPLYWWLILVGLLVWNVWAIMPRSQAVTDIPYSTFQDQVKAGNVSQVTLSGSDITGTLVKSISLPAATPVSGASPSVSATASPFTQFHTQFPDVVGDPNLISLLNSNNVQITAKPAATPWLMILLSNGLPLLLLLGVMAIMVSNASRGQAGIFKFGRSNPREYTIERPNVNFTDVAGEDEAKNDLKEVVDFLRNPEKYHKVGARVPRGILLVGQPGTGKTLLARAVAGEAGVPFFSISASEFVEMFVGIGASRVRDLFQRAKATSPAIVFIDELDAVGRQRGAGVGNVNDEREQTLNQLLVEMDGFDEHHEVIILAATNRPDVLDSALLRPGRFDRQVIVGLPDREGREGILKIHTRGLKLAKNVNLSIIARTTTGFSGADLANLCNEAALVAAREANEEVTMANFEEALDRILLGATRKLLLNEHDRRVVAYHEAGHALVAWLSPTADPVHKVTIVPRGRALGVTEQLPGDDHYNYSKPYLMTRLAVMMGGRGAEEVVIGEVTTGAENDLIQATRLARRMVTRWGMGRMGPIALDTRDEQPFLGYELSQPRDYSEETAARIDQDIQELVNTSYQDVRKLLSDSRPMLDRLVEALLKDETVNQDEMARILGPRPYPVAEDAAQPVGVSGLKQQHTNVP